MEIEALKKTQTKGILEMENLGEKAEITDASIANRIQKLEVRISGVEDTIEQIVISVKEIVKFKEFLTQNIQDI